MVGALIFMGGISLFGTLAAGRLLRERGHIYAIVWPYYELALPSIMAIIFANGLAFNLSLGRWADWQYFAAGAILCPIAGLAVYRNWHWLLRLALHAAWLTSLIVFVTRQVGH
jgi:hypothetical protein